MRFAPDSSLARPKAAFAIGKRAGTAVARNRLRRRLRELLRVASAQLPTGRYLLGARGPAAQISWQQAQADVTRLVARARSLR